MEQCEDVQDNTQEVLSKINWMIGEEKLRQNEFNNTLTIIQDLDSNKPEAFPLLYQFKKEDGTAQFDMSKEVANIYKSGKDDPSKLTGIEKMQKQAALRKRKLDKKLASQ